MDIVIEANPKYWPENWREQGHHALQQLLTGGLSINSSEYHEYMTYCHRKILFEKEKENELDQKVNKKV